MDRVLVVGGGVAGTAVALSLHKAGLHATVFERHAWGGDDAGAFLTLGGHGMLALDALDAAGPVADAGFGLHTLELTDSEGTSLGSRPLDPARHDVPGYQCLRRAELYRVLQDEAARRGVAIERGRRLVRTQRCADGVRAIFADGSSATGELLVGADGLRSTVRTVIDPEAPSLRYVGVQVFYGYADTAAPAADLGEIHMIRGSPGAFGYMVSPEGRIWWFARLHGPELSGTEIAGTPPGQWRDGLEVAFGRNRTPAAEIVAATGDQLFVTNAYDIPTLPAWHRDDMVVLGDAAHPASPASGQGASMALEDAVVLGKALRDITDRVRALDAFERLRRPRTEANVAASAALDAGQRPPVAAAERSAASAATVARWLDWNVPLDD